MTMNRQQRQTYERGRSARADRIARYRGAPAAPPAGDEWVLRYARRWVDYDFTQQHEPEEPLPSDAALMSGWAPRGNLR